MTTKQERRAAKLEARKEDKKLRKTLQRMGHGVQPSSQLPSGGSTAGPFFGGMRLVGSKYPVEVPLKLVFDADDDSQPEEAASAAAGGDDAPAFPRPPLSASVVVEAGWSNMSTHGFLSRACLLDPRTNELRKGVAVRGPPVQVGSHMGDFTSPGLVTVRALSPERLEEGSGPLAMEFYIFPGTPGVKEGMLGNEQLELLGVTDPMRHRTRLDRRGGGGAGRFGF